MDEKIWYYIDSGNQTPAYNMALDEYLTHFGAGHDFRVLRFYGWDPPGLSVGYFQKTEGRIDREGLRKHGFRLVRRPTGGRAVLHHQELTYSVILPEDYPGMPKSVVGAYRILSAGLLEGFRGLGLQADLAMPEKERAREHSAVCFEDASWYELVVEGRKAAGSAQMRQNGMILQHGSIPLSVDIDALFDCFLYKSPRVKERAKRQFLNKAVSISRLAGRPVSINEAKHAFYHGFEKGLGITFEPYRLTRRQEQEVHALAEEKYASDRWNYRR
ncbi:lipoate--protein ligase family protein [Sporolactobacillus sp. THM7-7]|nr:lipoate--protein ligase family protein [Sporolactobacillus sp. THM7-7]